MKADNIKLAASIKAILSAFGGMRMRDRRDSKGNVEANSDLRDHELVPYTEDWQSYIEREVTPSVPTHGWMKAIVTPVMVKWDVGYEINFNRYFYKYVPPRPLEEIEQELKQLELEISSCLGVK